MSRFFENLPLEAAQQLEQLSRLAFELRENGKQILQQHGANSADALLELIRTGVVAEHPGYDRYLAARVIVATREAVRSQLQATTVELGG